LALKGTFENVFGTHQADWIKGNAAANVIYGSSGDDAIYGGAGNDTLYGGPGDDWLYGDAGHDTLYGELGNNVLLGGTGNDLLDTDDGVVADLAGRNLLIGGAGVDTLRGGPGEEILIGGTTRYDSRPKSLAAVMAAWKSQELSFEDRCNKLDEGFQDTAGAGWVQLRRKDKKNAKGAVLDDAAADMFFGGAGKDWFLSFPSDDVRDRDPDAGDR
jgi:Ca2+-binding RTX toxin-like protein